jgi:hypothetical protein
MEAAVHPGALTADAADQAAVSTYNAVARRSVAQAMSDDLPFKVVRSNSTDSL